MKREIRANENMIETYSDKWTTSTRVPLGAGTTGLTGFGLGKVKVPEPMAGGGHYKYATKCPLFNFRVGVIVHASRINFRAEDNLLFREPGST